MPALGLGTWLSPADEVYHAVREAIATGYRHVDTAWIYFNEEPVGRAIRDAIAAGDVTREALWVTTKLWNDHHAPKHVRPGPEQPDEYLSLEAMPLEKTWEAMTALPASGLTRAVGVSNFSASKVDRIAAAVGATPEVNQVELHPFNAQNELLAHARHHDIVLTAYAPLGSRGRPPSMKSEDEPSLLEHPRVAALARAKGATPAQILIAWALARDTAVIPKSTNAARIRENFAAARVELGAEDMDALAELDAGARYVTGAFWCTPGSPYAFETFWD